MSYGFYRSSQFFMEFNRNIIMPGDVHHYMFLKYAQYYINHPRSTAEDRLIFLPEDFPDESADDGENVLISMISIFHELTHVVQDFTLGSQILKDILEDCICGYIYKPLSSCNYQREKLSFPIHLELDRTMDPEVHKLIDGYKAIFKTDLPIEFVDREEKQQITISTEDLIEAYAAVRSYIIMMLIEPAECKQSSFYSSFFINNLDDKYKKAWKVYKFAFCFNCYNEDKSCYDLRLDLLTFLFLCDIALHIPPFLVDGFGQDEENVPECCLPSKRFFCALSTSLKHAGLPDAVEGTDYYITLYDFIAKDNGWPTFQETNNRWSLLLQSRMNYTFMISDYFRYVSIYFKTIRANRTLTGHLLEIFSEIGIPIFSRYFDAKKKTSYFEYINVWHNNFIVIEQDMFNGLLKDPYIIMKSYYNRYSYQLLLVLLRKKGEEYILNLAPVFLREIYCRIVSKNFYLAVMEKENFCCPLAELNCQVKTDKCTCLKNLSSLPEYCCLKIWLKDNKINPDFMIWR